jgi:ABC-type protease/lipase transport system fused ATPase/permease subunit
MKESLKEKWFKALMFVLFITSYTLFVKYDVEWMPFFVGVFGTSMVLRWDFS